MKSPASAAAAAAVAAQLLERALPGRSVNVRAECDRAARIGAVIWDRWQVGPWQWRYKHVRWFLERGLAGYSAWTRYRYWLTVARLLQVTGQWNHWRGRLRGPWCAPK